MRHTRFPLLLSLTLSAAAIVGCSTAEAPRTGRFVKSPWSRAADSGSTGVVYLTFVNADSSYVELVGVSSDVAESAEIHETMIHDGMMHMTPHASTMISALDSLVLTPGGTHVMLNQLKRALVAGDSLSLTLRFKGGDSLSVRVPVRAP